MPKIIEDDQVYLAELQTITERGYGGATTKQIAEAANIIHGKITHEPVATTFGLPLHPVTS